MRIAAVVLLLASPAAAADLLTADGFESYVTGKTLAFTGTDGTIFGIEQYLPDRRVIWSGAPGDCIAGRWFDSDNQICFAYDGDPLPKCWSVSLTNTGLRAESSLYQTLLIEAQETTLTCAGPDLLS
ncbi:hypothetical protein [Loktanella sp. SALINAS62]|uniref:hypothetical protein n=1 Tax=Loktanella sp. SALINAS62 TaxID=2706124 RepID=UPI001B8D4CD3|nr:hypothetical protein [Loktanella sp. SALINAS62]MBS1303008.1 hypothetical protein [Loktanella sp. SALINAS62]